MSRKSSQFLSLYLKALERLIETVEIDFLSLSQFLSSTPCKGESEHKNMSRLHIKTLEREPGGDYILRFVGHRPEFMKMVEDLKYERCRWEPDAGQDRKGGWMVDSHLLMELAGADRFDNIWQLLHQEEDRRKAEQRRRSLAFEEKLARKLGIERDINEVPF